MFVYYKIFRSTRQRLRDRANASNLTALRNKRVDQLGSNNNSSNSRAAAAAAAAQAAAAAATAAAAYNGNARGGGGGGGGEQVALVTMATAKEVEAVDTKVNFYKEFMCGK